MNISSMFSRFEHFVLLVLHSLFYYFCFISRYESHASCPPDDRVLHAIHQLPGDSLLVAVETDGGVNLLQHTCSRSKE